MLRKPDFDHFIYQVKTPILYEKDQSTHCCKTLADETRLRTLHGESIVFIFRDFDESWYLKMGVEFVKVNFCLYCGEKLC